MAPLPYELRIGVTGHRTIADPDAVTRAMDHVLAHVSAALNDPSAPLALTVVSPLAQGADRLFARSALKRGGVRLEVVTPLPIAEYLEDFETPDDRREFEELLAKAARVDQLDLPLATEAPGNGGDLRDTAYLRAGERVVDACEILVAVWNGRRAAGTGGTADIVQHALREERLVIWIHADRPGDPPVVVKSVVYDAGDSLARVETCAMPSAASELSAGYRAAVVGRPSDQPLARRLIR